MRLEMSVRGMERGREEEREREREREEEEGKQETPRLQYANARLQYNETMTSSPNCVAARDGEDEDNQKWRERRGEEENEKEDRREGGIPSLSPPKES